MRSPPSAAANAPAARPPVRGSGERACAAPAGWCRACWEAEGLCPSCVGRRTWAFEQIEKHGRSVAEVAGCLHLRPERVERLVEQERDRRDRRSFNTRPRLAQARWFIDYELARDPELTRGEIARRMKPAMTQADFDRTFGYARRRGRPQLFISVEMGTRLMLALGRDPHELDGC